MAVLSPEVLDDVRNRLTVEDREQYTDAELDNTAYFLATSGLVPGAFVGVADANDFAIVATANYLAMALLPLFLKHKALDPRAISGFINGLQTGEIENPSISEKV